MEPNNNTRENEQTTIPEPTDVVAEVEETVAVEERSNSAPIRDDVAFTDRPKKKNIGMILGVICLAILAVAGVGFGVWAMMDKDSAVKDLNNQIMTLRSQNSDLSDQIEDLENQLIEATTEVVDCEVTPDAAECLDVEYEPAEPVMEGDDVTTNTNLDVTVTE